MKNRILAVTFMVIIFIFANAKASFGFSVELTLDKLQNIQKDDEITVIIKLDENIQGASFRLDYDSNDLELIGSNTANLTVGKKNGQIACVYFIMDGDGTNTLEIKFKVTDTTNKHIKFNMEDAKFITTGGKEYRIDDLSNESSKIVDITNKVEENNSKGDSSKDNAVQEEQNNNNNGQQNQADEKISNEQNNSKNENNKLEEPSKETDSNSNNKLDNQSDVNSNGASSDGQKAVVNSINDGISKDDTYKAVKKLPKTGDNSNYIFLGIGLAFGLMVFSLVKLRKLK